MSLKRILFRLRPEEAVALAFVLPTTWLTAAAYVYAREAGVLGPRYPGGVVRLAVAVLLLAALAVAQRRAPGSAVVRGLRETVPLLACFLIYTNLHDTIGFVNPHDVHHWLVAFDQMIFGVQPCVWAERLITPGRTEVMQFLYLNFFWIAPSMWTTAPMNGPGISSSVCVLAVNTLFSGSVRPLRLVRILPSSPRMPSSPVPP